MEAWFKNAINETIVTDSDGYHAEFATTDKNGFLYISEHIDETVQRYAPGSLNRTTVAGGGTLSSALNSLQNPLGIDVDDNLNLYVADSNNDRVMRWAPNATNGTLLIDVRPFSSLATISGLLLANNVPTQVYLSDESLDAVYLWTFGAAAPDVTLKQVRNGTALNTPRSIIFDPYGNLYVGEKVSGGRIVMYCGNSTMGEVIIAGSGTSYAAKHGIGLDSNLNLYALLDDGKLMKYTLL